MDSAFSFVQPSRLNFQITIKDLYIPSQKLNYYGILNDTQKNNKTALLRLNVFKTIKDNIFQPFK